MDDPFHIQVAIQLHTETLNEYNFGYVPIYVMSSNETVFAMQCFNQPIQNACPIAHINNPYIAKR